MSKFTCFLFALVLASGTWLAQLRLAEARVALADQHAGAREVLYLPSGEGLHFISFGYRNFLADILWFSTINYFGKHYESDRSYEWLNHMCELVVSLNPRADHVYKFCSNMLAWEANRPGQSIEMLSKAIAQYPDAWEYYYLRGFIYLFFLRDEDKARSDLTTSAALPEAPLLVQRLAAKKLALSDPGTAIEFLRDMIENAENESERNALVDRLNEAVYERDARLLEQALAVFQQRHGRPAERLSELVEAGFINQLTDPFGGEYRLDPQSGVVVSSTGRKRIQLYESEHAKQIRGNNE